MKRENFVSCKRKRKKALKEDTQANNNNDNLRLINEMN